MQYRNDPGRNINPFSMRLQGIIDANVMGGIRKYQEAFFSEEFAASHEGRGQQCNVQYLKSLILDQIQVLDTALALHGMLAPEDVQPLHNRLLERYCQLKQSTSSMERSRKQMSESIVNTPLPPLPVEKTFNMSAKDSGLNNCLSNLDNDEQTQYSHEQSDVCTFRMDPRKGLHQHQCHMNIEQSHKNTSSVGGESAPPIPICPKSTDCIQNATASPEIPPKTKDTRQAAASKLSLTTTAPPLPPRGCTLDKPVLRLNKFNVSHLYSEVHIEDKTLNWSQLNFPRYQVANMTPRSPTNVEKYLEEANTMLGCEHPSIKFSYSGVSANSNDLNEPNAYDEYDPDSSSNGNNGLNDSLNFMSLKISNDSGVSPPPVPKKTSAPNELVSSPTPTRNIEEDTATNHKQKVLKINQIPPDESPKNITATTDDNIGS